MEFVVSLTYWLFFGTKYQNKVKILWLFDCHMTNQRMKTLKRCGILWNMHAPKIRATIYDQWADYFIFLNRMSMWNFNTKISTQFGLVLELIPLASYQFCSVHQYEKNSTDKCWKNHRMIALNILNIEAVNIRFVMGIIVLTSFACQWKDIFILNWE